MTSLFHRRYKYYQLTLLLLLILIPSSRGQSDIDSTTESTAQNEGEIVVETTSLSSNTVQTSPSTAQTSPSTIAETSPSTTSPTSPTPVPRHSGTSATVVYDSCPCDLMSSACDIDCCCDEDCSTPAHNMFTSCSTLDSKIYVDDNYCYQEPPIVWYNKEYYNVTTTSAGLFCIFIDNYKDRKYYKNMYFVETDDNFNNFLTSNVVTSEDEFVSEVDEFISTYEYESDSSDAARHYKLGDPVLVTYSNGMCDVMKLPAAGVTGGICGSSWSNAGKVLVYDTWVCYRVYSGEGDSLGEACQSDITLSASVYYQGISVLSTPAYMNVVTRSNNTSNDQPSNNATSEQKVLLTTGACGAPQSAFVTVIPDISCAGSTETSCIETVLDGDICGNIVHSVQYNIVVNASGAIKNVTAAVTVQNLPISTRSVKQSFTYNYIWLEQEDGERIERSGNPGYQVGKALIIGRLQSDDVGVELLSSLSTLVSARDGRCGNHERKVVGFGVDTLSGCMMEVNAKSFSASCQRIQNDVLEYLLTTWLGNVSVDELYVASFGNSNISDTSQWVKVIVYNMPQLPDLSDMGGGAVTVPNIPRCEQLSLGLHITVLYAKQHSYTAPQAKIVGVRFRFEEARSVQLRCVAAQCESSRYKEIIEVSSRVTFVDVSQPLVIVEARMPRLETKLPYDFFYPFFLSRSAKLISCNIHSLFVLILLSFIVITFTH